MIENIKKQFKKIDPEKYYSTTEIHDMGVILNNSLEPDLDTIYRRIRRKDLVAVNWGTEKMPKYYVLGSDLKSHLDRIYKLSK